MKAGKYFDELTFWVLLAIGITLFVIPAKAFGKVLVAKWAPDGLKEAFAA